MPMRCSTQMHLAQQQHGATNLQAGLCCSTITQILYSTRSMETNRHPMGLTTIYALIWALEKMLVNSNLPIQHVTLRTTTMFHQRPLL